jgi:cytochrome c peroxidase
MVMMIGEVIMKRQRRFLGFTPVLMAGLILALIPVWNAIGQETFPSLGPLPPVPVPSDAPQTPARVQLGKLLYFDPR